MLEEMAAARHERERWQQEQAASEVALAAEKQRFESLSKSQVRAVGRCGLCSCI